MIKSDAYVVNKQGEITAVVMECGCGAGLVFRVGIDQGVGCAFCHKQWDVRLNGLDVECSQGGKTVILGLGSRVEEV